MAPSLLGLDRSELARICGELGEPPYRAGQLAAWLYRRGARDVAGMTDLPAAFRERLAAAWQVGRSRVAADQRAADGTRKLLLELADRARVETVLLPYDERVSLCISSQTGCAVGCTFCATGSLGAGRNLSAGELTDQLLTAPEVAGERVSNVVFMGMGEPLLNLEAVIAAIRLWRDEVAFSPRHVTISTVGIPARIGELAAAELPVTLAVSLHAGDDELRASLVPTTRWSVAQVVAAARGYQQRTGRRVTYEVVLLRGVNDEPSHAFALAHRLKRGEHVNLIPYNPVPRAPYERPEPARVAAFRRVLEARGLTVTQRQTRGDDIAGACGQLRAGLAEAASRPAPSPAGREPG
ncbi:MAG: 23S rRNA (adenine(2503)-C(2))-methyltransferase RlmN [Armatimonadetes bacterium]|nr:23S rRNA (adenine(2503)-C(2))-methyltransferase RlmN [Armatimonadota bacterium]